MRAGATEAEQAPVARAPLRRAPFAADERGTATTEFVITIPLLIWAFVAMFSYWDIYATRNVLQKATFVVADTLARTPVSVPKSYIDGLRGYENYLIGRQADTKLRVTSIRWNDADATYEVSWSYSPGGRMPVRTNASLTGVETSLPVMSEFETALLVEASLDYAPPIAEGMVGSIPIGFAPQTFNEFYVMRPRFIPKVCVTQLACP